MTLTKKVVQKLLNLNEGFSQIKSWSGRNIKIDYHYLIEGGKLIICEKGNTSWADSWFDEKRIADIEQTRRFLREYLHLLKVDN